MFTRRQFIQSSAVLAAGAVMSHYVPSVQAEYKTCVKKAILGGIPSEAQMEQWLKWGIEGMEITGGITREQAEATRKSADKTGFRIHSVMGGGSPERIELAAAMGCDGVLLVPGRVSGMPMPQPWEFKIQFNDKTNELISVVEGDNEPYKAYIEAHNKAMEGARKHVESLIPVAEKNNIVICLENVWNNMWVQPKFAANFIQSFKHPNVKAYFDIGNHVKYANPLEWFDLMPNDIFKVHLKDFKLNDNGQGGRFAKLMEGSVDWRKIRDKMEEVGYNGWMSVELEGCPLPIEEQGRRMGLIASGQPLVL